MNREKIGYAFSESSLHLENKPKYEKPQSEELNDEPIKWINIIFLPFQFWWQVIILYLVCVKCFFGPLRAVMPFLTCSPVVHNSTVQSVLKVSYVYLTDIFYIFDTFLFILHRQVEDEAMKHEYLPKPASLILVDILSLIPFYGLFLASECGRKRLWPNLLCFSEFLCIYRVGKFFSLNMTHSSFKLLVGYTIMFILVLNATTCFLLLLTMHGLCQMCAFRVRHFFDWRAYKISALFNAKDYNLSLYMNGCQYVLSLLRNYLLDNTTARTYNGYILSCFIMSLGYFLVIFVVMPKLFAENVLAMRPFHVFNARAKRITEESKRRSNSPTVYASVENYYRSIWKLRDGISYMPKAITYLPSAVRVEIMQDLIWPVFTHSPILRKTSPPYKRWLGQHISIKYKLPGERFFTGPHSDTSLYYIKSGIVQFISNDDSTAPMLSVYGGTMFGDISFLIPAMKRDVTVCCLTSCQVFTITRADMIKSLYKFPSDSSQIHKLVRLRLQHAHDLFGIKKGIRGLDRSEDEGIMWLKQRWWEISNIVTRCRRSISRKKKCEIPCDEQNYHCARFIGMLVLCNELELQRTSMFVKVKFPFILAPYSNFVTAWSRIVMVTIYLVLLIYPPNILRNSLDKPLWFVYVSYVVDIIFMLDVIVSLFTAAESEEKLESNLVIVMYQSIKKKQFIIDLMSTYWFERLIVLILGEAYAGLAPFNRLIKVYHLFSNRYKNDWNQNRDILWDIFFIIFLSTACFLYIWPYIMYTAIITTSLKTNVTRSIFYGHLCDDYFIKMNLTDGKNCTLGIKNLGILEIAVVWLVELLINPVKQMNIYDIVIGNVTILFVMVFFLIQKMKLVSTLYWRYLKRVNYQYFVSNLKRHHGRLKAHPDMLQCVDGYLNCHWKYHHGSDILHTDLLKGEPYDIYWKLHGDVAEKVISKSSAFLGGDKALIKELARKVRFLILPKDYVLLRSGYRAEKVMWIIDGVVKVEYTDDKGDLVPYILQNGNVLSLSSVFLDRNALKTYTSITDVEILYLKRQELFSILKRYPLEWSYFLTCEHEFGPMFDEIHVALLKKRRKLQRSPREQNSDGSAKKQKSRFYLPILNIFTYVSAFFRNYRTDPESAIIQYWMTFRVFVLFISLMCRPLYYVVIVYRKILFDYIIFANIVSALDIIIKMFIPYYDYRGLVISDLRNCAYHYVTRGFLPDCLGLIFGVDAISHVLSTSDSLLRGLLQNLAHYFHLYLLIGYFNYYVDKPSANIAFFMITKWLLALVPIASSVTKILFEHCVEISDNNTDETPKMIIKENCWMPNYFGVWEKECDINTLQKIIASAFHAVITSFFLNNGIGNFGIFDYDYLIHSTILRIFITGLFWVLTSYFLSILILKNRGDVMFQQGVAQLITYLKAERINAQLINRVLDHFTYWSRRISGVNVKVLVNERIGAIFQQDLNYYFLEETLQAADLILRAGESIQRQIAGFADVRFFLPGEDIAREMDLVPNVFIVHRGRVEVFREGRRLAVLTKGALFGQLLGIKVRPIKITARAEDKADVLCILLKDFQHAINDDVRIKISDNSHYKKEDYIPMKKSVVENPYNTIEYLMRGNRAIRFPYMSNVVMQNSKWYSRWLLLVLYVNPVVSTALTLLDTTYPKTKRNKIITYCLLATDFIHLVHFITEFFTLSLEVVNKVCVYQYKILSKFKSWRLYTDFISLCIPFAFMIHENSLFHLARILRIHAVCLYHRYFCNSIQRRTRSIVIKVTMLLLLLHALACGFMLVACRNYTGEDFPVQLFNVTESKQKQIDETSWILMQHSKEHTCHVNAIRSFANVNKFGKSKKVLILNFLAPTAWQADYLIAFTYVLVTLTTTNIDFVAPVTVSEIYYETFVTILLYFVSLWITSAAISSVSTSYGGMYNFDYKVKNLLKYLKRNGVSDCLRYSAKTYAKLLWLRTKGNWLPRITYQAPLCMQEDILGALYMHHLLTPLLFRNLPEYFLRQLAVRLQRTVYFPGKVVVQEGDINPQIYFIHDGEVEKWYTDSNGENRLSTVLTINGYFGLIPGIFPSQPYVFTYYTRTVVDFVYLQYETWRDLLQGYPDIKHEIYAAASKLAIEQENQLK